MNYEFSDKISSLKPSAIREILKFTADPSVIPFAAGNPAPEAFPVEKIEAIVTDILTKSPISALQYSVTEGYPPLREAVAERMKEVYGLGGQGDETVIVSGAQQGIELSCKVLCNEGDVVICENPSFIGSLNSFRSYNCRLAGVPMEADGISLTGLEQALRENDRVKMIYLIPNFQNPSGSTMSLAKRRAVYRLAQKFGVIILEDNPYGDLRFEGEDVASIKSMDTDGLVIYCGSFSKILAPGIRVGWVTAPTPIVSKITVAKQGADVHTNILWQMVAQRFLTETDFAGHIAHLKEIYRKKCGLMLEQMARNFPKEVTWVRPQGGLFILCRLPEETDMIDFCARAVRRGVAVVPGNAFAPDPNEVCHTFRMNFSTPTDEQIVRGIEVLGGLLKEIF